MLKVQVPINITLRWELFRGFGRNELIRSFLITAITGVFGIVFCLFSTWPAKNLLAIAVVIFVFAFCVGLFSRMENNQSIYDFYKRRADFQKRQQKFYYKKEREVIVHAQEKTESW